MPEKYKGRMHFYNTAFSADIGEDASHPLNIMRSLFKPGDMFVVKLDIDNVPLELNFLAAIEADPSLLQMIAEMFFEGHYDHAGNPLSEHTHSHALQCGPRQDSLAHSRATPDSKSAHHACSLTQRSALNVVADMEVSFGLKNGRTLADVRRRFAALRRAGLSLHYWP